METTGQPITAVAVATAAGVTTWLVDADGIREHLNAARQRQAVDGDTPASTGTRISQQPVTSADLRTDLAVVRHEIHSLGIDLVKLRGRLRRKLGTEIEQPDLAELIARGRRVGSREPPAPRRTRRPRKRGRHRPKPRRTTRKRPHRRPRMPPTSHQGHQPISIQAGQLTMHPRH